MDVAVAEAPPHGVEADVLGFGVPDPAELPAGARDLDARLDGRLSRLVDDGELTGSPGDLTLVHAGDGVSARRLAAVGVGAPSDAGADAVRTAAATLSARTGRFGARTVAWLLEPDGGALTAAEQASAVAEGVLLGRYDAGRWKTDGARREPVERLVLCGEQAGAAVDAARRGALVAGWANQCRDIVNAPPNELTPARLADIARDVADRFAAISFAALGRDEIRDAGMGAFAAVAQGSHNDPRLITLSYEPEGARGDLLLGLVGKALTFDTGGISLKPAENMEEMKSDMSGGAAVVAALGAVAELGLPVRILGVVPAAENMPGGHSYRPGDIVTAANGKTIEVTNTDAEGRLVLADALWYARQNGATHVVDLATLTGTIQVALGDVYAGLFGDDEEWLEAVRSAATASGDRAWPFPLDRAYMRHLDSLFADVKNSPEKKRGSSIIAALFLREFTGEGPWAHLDIAGTAFLDRPRDYYVTKGATGYGVRLLTELARSLAEAER